MFLLSSALSASSQTPAPDPRVTAAHIQQTNDAYSSCVMQQTLRLGANNHETADTILLAVRSICAPQQRAMEQTFPPAGVLRHIQAKAEGDAVAALLEARLKTP